VAALVMPAAWLVSLGGLAGVSAAPALQYVAVACWLAHFVRRSLESAFLHRYSKPSFPWGDAIVEYLYYWGFGFWIGWSLAGVEPESWFGVRSVGILVFALAELGNHAMHRQLAALRSDGAVDKRLPEGRGFQWVSSPHYSFEVTSWIGFTLLTLLPAAACFLALATAILSFWAWQRHKAYHELFPATAATPYPPRRRALVPFVF
jgi:very-long-chain enoyl-CoA reductase